MRHAFKKGAKRPKLKIPLPDDRKIRDAIVAKYFASDEWEGEYTLLSGELKAIADYTGLSIRQVINLPLSLFLLFKKDSWIANNLKSQQGRDFLKDLYRLQQTEADVDAIRKFNKKRGD